MAFSVSSKTALITGAGSGICLAFTQLLLSQNCNVFAVDIRLTSEAEDAFKQSTSKSADGKKARVVFHKADVTDWTQLDAAFEACVKEFGRLDVVCPGAGNFEPEASNFWHPIPPSSKYPHGPPHTFPLLDLNLTHPLRATQLAIHHFRLLGNTSSVILHISSIAAQLALLPTPLYSASKHAISSIVRSLAPLSNVGIKTVAVAPGIVKTPIWTAEKLAWVDESTDKWVSVSQVADVMLQVVEKEEYAPGTVVEIGVGKTRRVEELNDPGPGGDGEGTEGFSVGKVADAFGKVFGQIEEGFGRKG